MLKKGLLVFALVLFFGGSSLAAPTAAYIRGASQPWGRSTNEAAMTKVFGAVGTGWDDLRMADGAGPFLVGSGYSFIFLEGSDSTANELNAYLSAYRTEIEDFVSTGGSLLLNSAPNQGGNIDFGFRGITLVYQDFSSSVTAAIASHPVFSGPFAPVGTSYTGNFFAHATVSGPGISPIIYQSSGPDIVLGEMPFGNGFVLFGGMTTDNFHSPQPQAANLLANIISYASGAVPIQIPTDSVAIINTEPGGENGTIVFSFTVDDLTDVTGFRVYFSAVPGIDATHNYGSIPIHDVTAREVLLTQEWMGMKGVPFIYFRIATMDGATPLSFSNEVGMYFYGVNYSSDRVSNATDDAVNPVDSDTTTTTTEDTTTPDDGAGPASTTTTTSDSGSGSKMCFIATAAYGSPYQAPVTWLRKFRDQYLLTNAPGQWFVKTYYRMSPPLADVIAGHGWMRPIVRVLLLPLVAMSYVLVEAPPMVQVGVALSLALAFSWLVARMTRRRRVVCA